MYSIVMSFGLGQKITFGISTEFLIRLYFVGGW